MLETLPDLKKLSDDELKVLPQKLQAITLKTLEALGAELESGIMTSEETFAKSDQIMHWTTAQQELIFAEQMRRANIVSRKRMIIKMTLIILVGIAIIAITVLEALKLPGVL